MHIVILCHGNPYSGERDDDTLCQLLLLDEEFGVGDITLPDREKTVGIKVLGISGSSRWEPGMSKSERLLLRALEQYKVAGCETTFLRLKDLKIYECEGNYSENPSYCTYPCQSSMKYEDDEMQVVYDAVLACDILILATPIRWNNHSALVQKFVERMNCIENQYSWFGNRMIRKKVVGLDYYRSCRWDAACCR